MRDFFELQIWKKGHLLALDIYRITKNFPKSEMFGLTSQMRRSCISIPANISEGCGRNSNAEMKRYLTIASGSCSELQCHVLISKDLGYISIEIYTEIDSKISTLRKMIYKFIQNIPS